MQLRRFGTTGLSVSVLGLGAGQVGESGVGEAEAAALLHGTLDAGVTLLDTARSYGLSEERIGRHLAGRRSEFVLSSKGGAGVTGAADWTAAAVTRGIEDALRRLHTDVIDVYHLHSCSVAVLRRGEVVDALEQAVAAGKIRVPAYSGENEPLAYAMASRRFGSIETSVNLADQWSLRNLLPERGGLGVIGKRPIANAVWRFAERPTGVYGDIYWDRLQRLALDPGGLAWDEFALRFSAYAPGVDSVIVGTSKLGNLERNLAMIERGSLPEDLLAAVDAAWRREGEDWPGDV